MLTDVKCRKACTAERDYKLADSQGLHLFVRKSGTKTWRFKYRFGGKEKLLTIGEYPTVGLKDARDARDRAKADLTEGRDPAIVRRQKRLTGGNPDTTFEAVARRWHTKQISMWKPVHAYDVLHSLERDVFPHTEGLDMRDLTPPMVLNIVEKIEKRGAGETAHRVCQRINSVFAYAIASGVADQNPAAQIKLALAPVKKGRQPALDNLKELLVLVRKIEVTPAHPTTKLALRLLSLVVMRPGEVLRSEKTEFIGMSGNHPEWHIPAERMKMDRPFIVPLSRQAVETVLAAHKLSGKSNYLFPSTRHAYRPMSLDAPRMLLNRAGYYQRHVPHGFRASFSTIMNERHPTERHIIDFMLAHKPKDEIEAAYNRALYLERRAELAQEWADLLMKGALPVADIVTGPRVAPAGSSLAAMP